jgi:hypothetical protein
MAKVLPDRSARTRRGEDELWVFFERQAQAPTKAETVVRANRTKAVAQLALLELAGGVPVRT